MVKFSIFGAGFTGGMTPVILRFAIDLSNHRPIRQVFDPSGLLGVLLLALLGALVTFFYGETDVKRAFSLGIGLPSLLTVGVAQATQPNPVTSPQESKKTSSIFRLPHIYAAAGPVKGRLITIAGSGTLPDSSFQLVFNPNRDDVSVSPIQVGAKINVPPTAFSVLVRSPIGESNSEAIPDGPNQVITATLAAKKNALYGLFYAFGAHSNPYDLVLTISSQTRTNDVVIVKSPKALAFLPKTGLLILQRDGAILTLNGGVTKSLYAISPSYEPIDMATANISGKEYIFVAGQLQAGHNQSALFFTDTAVTTKALESRLSMLGDVRIAGLAVDSATARIYAANSFNQSLSGWQFADKLGRQFIVGSLQGIGSFEGLAIDDGHAYIGNPAEHEILQVALARGNTHKVIHDTPDAFHVFAIDGNTLYAGGGRTVTAYSLSTLSPRISSREFKNVSGLAVDQNHNLWISDFDSGIVKMVPAF